MNLIALPKETLVDIDQRYTPQYCLDSGGYCTVYKALDTTTGKHVVIKILRTDFPAHIRSEKDYREQQSAHFSQEARILSAVTAQSVAGVPQLHASTERAIVMDYVEGTRLWALIRSVPDWVFMVKVCLLICDVLARLHGLPDPVIFCDLNLFNVLYASGGVTLIDFGLAREMGKSIPKPLRGLGSPLFAAPELYPCDGEGKVSQGTDIYSLGALLFFQLTEQGAKNLSLSQIRSALTLFPAQLVDLILAMLHHEALGRPALWEVQTLCRNLLAEQRGKCGPGLLGGNNVTRENASEKYPERIERAC